MKDGRQIAYEVLFKVYKDRAYANRELAISLEDLVDVRDRNLVREIVYGVLENDIYLEHIIGQVSKRPLDRIDLDILVLIKIGSYQILFLDGIVDRAAVYETVEIAKKIGRGSSSSFINGILRNIIRKEDQLKNIKLDDEIERISIRYSHPSWLVRMWAAEFGLEFTEKLCRANNTRPEFTIRRNGLKISKENLVYKLKKKGYVLEDSKLAKDSLIVKNPENMVKLEEYLRGLYSIQGTSSTLIGELIDPSEGSTVIDLCAAPGGKSTYMAELMGNSGRIIARDIYDHKIEDIIENSRRLGINIIEASIGDGSILDDSLLDLGDYCLVDAPCSGFGTIRKNPEIKIFREGKDIDRLEELQRKILHNASKYLKVGGSLIYSTCTIGRKENDNIIRDFLKENPNYDLEPIMRDGISTDEGFIKLFPHVHGTDGFFMASMRRKY